MIKEILETESSLWDKIGHPNIVYKFVLRNGVEKKNPIQADPMGEVKMCFKNAFHYAWDHDLRYVEGYALRPSLCIPIHHAWCLDKEGRVVETTWEDAGDAEYLGVPFSWQEAGCLIAQNDTYGLFIPNGAKIDVDMMIDRDPEIEEYLQSLINEGPRSE